MAHQGSPFSVRACPSPPLSFQPEGGCGFFLLLLHHFYIQFPALNSFRCKYLETAGSFFLGLTLDENGSFVSEDFLAVHGPSKTSTQFGHVKTYTLKESNVEN